MSDNECGRLMQPAKIPRFRFYAALNGQTDVVSVLLSRGSYEADEKDSCGSTPLMDALRAGFVHIAKVLIEQQHVCKQMTALTLRC